MICLNISQQVYNKGGRRRKRITSFSNRKQSTRKVENLVVIEN